MHKYMILAMVLAAGCCATVCEQDKSGEPIAKSVSPDGHNEIRLYINPLAYEVVRDSTVVVAKSEIGMKINGSSLEGQHFRLKTHESNSSVSSPVYKKSKVSLAGNKTEVNFGDWSIRLAARNDGVAYRFETRKGGKVRVDCEKAIVSVPCPKARCWTYYTDRFGCEEAIARAQTAGEIVTGAKNERNREDKMVYLPFVYTIGGKTVAVTESDVYDYPIWNFTRTKPSPDAPVEPSVRLDSLFSAWPTKLVNNSNVDMAAGAKRERQWKVTEQANYLVETEGTRTFPWRTFILADQPAKLCEADIVWALARNRAKDRDFSWVKPGKVSWDWWNSFDNIGDPEGCTTKTYERFIDFAAKNGVEYVIMDEGWSEKLNIWKYHPNVDVPHLIKYANERKVGIILWMAWAQVVNDEERVASYFSKLGAKGFKVDFMDRGDADCERFLWKFADACARNHMLVDYHGAHRPTGMSRAYPNVLNFEGIHGLECMKWFGGRNRAIGEGFMANDVMSFYCRMTAGPMDYTPGAMDNYPLDGYPKFNGDKAHDKQIKRHPGSVGTRCHQMAMMVLYEAPLQMLSDSPTKYEKNMESFRFMAATPVTWADTIGLGGCPDSYAMAARKTKNGAWYAAAISNGESREVTVDTAFLGKGNWKAEIFRDAEDSDTKPTRYVHETGKPVAGGDKLTFKLANGGGFVVRFSK